MSNTNVKWKFMKLNGELNRNYKVSSEGEIINTKTKQVLKQQDMRKKSPKNGSDYKSVKIKGIKSPVRAHRIVCETFHGVSKISNKNIVNHIDEFKNNNDESNLEWVTSSGNSKAFWANNTPPRYSVKTISRVKTMLNKGWTNDRIAQKVGMGDSNVSAIKVGKIHKDVQPAITAETRATINKRK